MNQLDLFDSFQDNFAEVERVYKIAQEKYLAAKKLRDDNCVHLDVVRKEKYYEGNYYDKAYTESWYECSTCGVKLGKKHESHSWYG